MKQKTKRLTAAAMLLWMPTANLELPPGSSLPPAGVYIAQAALDGQIYGAIVHIGPRPTVDSDPWPSIEAHILDFSREICGQALELRLFARPRGPQRFANFSLLLAQVQADCSAARRSASARWWGGGTALSGRLSDNARRRLPYGAHSRRLIGLLGQRQSKAAAAPLLALDRDGPAVGLHDGLHQRQPDAGAAGTALPGAVGAVKTLKN